MSTEENFPRNYANIYPITKMAGEYLARYYFDRKEVECISLRYFNTYGPGENTKSQYASVVWRFVKALSKGERAVIYGDREQKRDFIYAIVREEMHSDLEAEHVPNPLKNYQYFTQADMAKTMRDLGFMPEYTLRSGIRSMLQDDIRSI